MRLFRLVSIPFLFLSLSLPLLAQPGTGRWFRIGVTGGVPLMHSNISTNSSQGTSINSANIHWDRYTVGVSFEAYLNDHISVEFNPLHRRTTANQVNLMPASAPGVLRAVNTGYENYVIDLPVIGKYTFRDVDDNWRPYVGAGFAFNTALQTVSVQNTEQPGPSVTPTNQYNQWAPWDTGAVFDAGVRYHVGGVEIAPEFRYTRWGGANLTHSRNQPEFLVSVRF